MQNYDNMIAKARLENNAQLAKIASEAFQQQLTIAMDGVKLISDLKLAKEKTKQEIKNDYFTRWQSVINQINTENALKETKRHNEKVEAAQAAQLAEEKRQFNVLHPSTDSNKMEKTDNVSTGGVKIVSKNDGIRYSATKTAASEILAEANKDKEPQPDLSSLNALGLSGKSPEYIDKLIRQGVLEEYESGGKLKYRLVIPNFH